MNDFGLVVLGNKLLFGFPAGECWAFALAGWLHFKKKILGRVAIFAALVLVLAQTLSAAAFTRGAPVLYTVATMVAAVLALRCQAQRVLPRILLPVATLLAFEHLYANVLHEYRLTCSWEPTPSDADGAAVLCPGSPALTFHVYSDEVLRFLKTNGTPVELGIVGRYRYGVLESMELQDVARVGFNHPLRYIHFEDDENAWGHRLWFF